jgi:hypothetical protein
MGQEIPSASAVAVVVEPGAEDEICGDCEEEAVSSLVSSIAELSAS